MTTTALPPWLGAALDSLRAGDIDGYMAMYADDAVHELPFAPEDRPARLEGKAAITAYMSQLPGLVKFESFEAQVCEVGDEVMLEATARGRAPARRSTCSTSGSSRTITAACRASATT